MIKHKVVDIGGVKVNWYTTTDDTIKEMFEINTPGEVDIETGTPFPSHLGVEHECDDKSHFLGGDLEKAININFKGKLLERDEI